MAEEGRRTESPSPLPSSFHRRAAAREGVPPFQTLLLVTFSHKARATLFFVALVYIRQTWGGFGSEMENEKVAKKKTADILLELFEWCVGHTEVYPCAGCSRQLMIRMRTRKKRTVSQWKQERSNMAKMDETHETHYINCTGQPRYLGLLLRA